MGLRNSPPRRFIGVKGGKFVLKSEGKEVCYDEFEGRLTGLRVHENTYNGQPIKSWNFHFADTDGSEYILSLSYRGGVAASLINCLANCERYGLLKLRPYMKGEFNRLYSMNDDEAMKWKVDNLPPAKIMKVNGKEVKDYTERMALIEKLAGEVKERLTVQAGAEGAFDPPAADHDAPPVDDDDVPF